MVKRPVIAHAPISRAGDCVSRAISAETMKMPEPIIEPITSMVALVRPRPLTSSWSWWVWRSQSLTFDAGAGGETFVLTNLLAGWLQFTACHRRLKQFAKKLVPEQE